MSAYGPGRLDSISRANLAGIGRSWHEVLPNDSPPVDADTLGNVPPGCFALYVGMEGFVRFITRGASLNVSPSAHANVDWVNAGMPSNVSLMLGGSPVNVVWLPAIRESVRVWAPAGTYLWAEVVHVLAHDSSATNIFALAV